MKLQKMWVTGRPKFKYRRQPEKKVVVTQSKGMTVTVHATRNKVGANTLAGDGNSDMHIEEPKLPIEAK